MHTYQVDNLIQWIGTLAILGGLTLLAYRWMRRSAEQRHELRLKILERFSSQEFVALLETDGGRQWAADVLSGRGPSNAIDDAWRRAIVLTCIGAGLIGSAFIVHSRPLGVLGAIILFGSIGLWISTWVAGRRNGPP